VLVQDVRKKQRLVKILRPGDHFGEVALMTKSCRTASVFARSYCTLAVLDEIDFNRFLLVNPDVVRIFKQTMH